MRIVIGMPVAERGWVLPEWFEAIESQKFPSFDADVEVVALYTESRDNTLSLLLQHGAKVIPSMLPTRERGRIVGHCWSYSTHEYEFMASLRNTLRKEVLLLDADYFFSLDSDIILPNELALHNLVAECMTLGYDAVSPLVNMISEPGFSPAWNFMSWSKDGASGTRTELFDHFPFDASIIMAAMLLNKRAQCISWMNHRQGEDIGWSLNARRSNLKLGVIPYIECPHRMKINGGH